MLHRHDRRLVRDVLHELSAPIRHFVEQLSVVRSDAGERDEIVRRHEHVDEVELQDADRSQYFRKPRRVDAAPLTRATKALRSEGDAAGVGERELRQRSRPVSRSRCSVARPAGDSIAGSADDGCFARVARTPNVNISRPTTNSPSS